MTQESKSSKSDGVDNFPMLRVIVAFAVLAILEVYLFSVYVPDDHVALLSDTNIFSDYVQIESPAQTEMIAIGKKKPILPRQK